MDATRIRFRFQAYGQNGGHEAGFVDALDEADAVRQLRGTGKVPYEIKRAEANGNTALSPPVLRPQTRVHQGTTTREEVQRVLELGGL